MLVRKASWGVVHSGLTARERCGASYTRRIGNTAELQKHYFYIDFYEDIKAYSAFKAYQVYKVQGEYVNTAGHSGQSTNDGGENAETTCTEQKVLWTNTFKAFFLFQWLNWSKGWMKVYYPLLADVGLSGSLHWDTGQGSPPLWWSKSEWAHNKHIGRSPPTYTKNTIET